MHTHNPNQPIMNPLTRLHARLDRAFKVKHPGYTLTIPRKTYRLETANGLQSAIIDYIKSFGYQAERVNTTGIIRNGKWTRSGGTLGSADVHATIQGRSCKFEIKIGKDRQSDVQRKYSEQIRSAGGVYEIIKTLQDFFDWWDSQSISDNLRAPDTSPLETGLLIAELPDQVVKERPIKRKLENTTFDVMLYAANDIEEIQRAYDMIGNEALKVSSKLSQP